MGPLVVDEHEPECRRRELLHTQSTRLCCRADTHKQGIDLASAGSADGPTWE